MKTRNSSGARGFSLIEVMVALVVICVGMLGIAKMQALAVSSATTSRLRALAAFEAAGLAGAMHSNRAYWGSTPANFNLVINPKLAPVIATANDAALQAQANADYPGNLAACVGTNAGLVACQPMNLAAYDLARWTNSLVNLLPNPSAVINCPNAAGVNAPTACTIQITWTETAVAMTQQEAAQQTAGNVGQFEVPTYTLYVEP